MDITTTSRPVIKLFHLYRISGSRAEVFLMKLRRQRTSKLIKNDLMFTEVWSASVLWKKPYSDWLHQIFASQ